MATVSAHPPFPDLAQLFGLQYVTVGTALMVREMHHVMITYAWEARIATNFGQSRVAAITTKPSSYAGVAYGGWTRAVALEKALLAIAREVAPKSGNATLLSYFSSTARP